MLALLNNRLTYLSTSLLLLVAAVPLISTGTSRGIHQLWYLGLAALTVGGLIPPAQRFLIRTPDAAD
jgi:hypothetical protein